MDVASIIFKLTISIVTFISEHDDRHAITKEIHNTTHLIQVALQPLFADPKELEKNESVKECLPSIQETLRDLLFHLRLWKESRPHRALAFVHPSMVTQQLRDDRQLLIDRYIILMGAMQFVNHLHGYNVITPTHLESVTAPPPTTHSHSSSHSVSEFHPLTFESKGEPENSEVTKFWHHSIGSRTKIVNTEDFCHAISAYLSIKLSRVARKRLIFRLDETNTGHVAFSTLQELVKRGKMSDVISAYSEDPQLPLLIWIDDDVSGNGRHKVLEAVKHGVAVIQLASTSAAKTWIKINLDYLKTHDNPGEIRFISDQLRVEPDANGVMFENHHAGTEIMKFIRDQGLKAPIIIYTNHKHRVNSLCRERPDGWFVDLELSSLQGLRRCIGRWKERRQRVEEI